MRTVNSSPASIDRKLMGDGIPDERGNLTGDKTELDKATTTSPVPRGITEDTVNEKIQAPLESSVPSDKGPARKTKLLEDTSVFHWRTGRGVHSVEHFIVLVSFVHFLTVRAIESDVLYNLS